jgi:cobalamin biosynthesis protein CobW
VDAENLDKVKSWLKLELTPQIKIVPCQDGEINPDVLLGFNAAVEDHLESRPSHHDHEEDHEHDDDINSVQFILEQAFEPTKLIDRLKQLVQKQEIYRIKGFVQVPGKPMRMVLQGVGDRFDSFYDRPWKSDELRQTKLVFIGRSLNQEDILSVIC